MTTGSLGATSGGHPHTGGTPVPTAPSNGHRPARPVVAAPLEKAIRALFLVTGGLIAVYLASTLFRHHPGTITLYDGWVGNLAYGGCALLCVLRALSVKDKQRAGWTAIAVALVLF